MPSFVQSFFPLDVLDEIWDLIESVFEGFLTYSFEFPNIFIWYRYNVQEFKYKIQPFYVAIVAMHGPHSLVQWGNPVRPFRFVPVNMLNGRGTRKEIGYVFFMPRHKKWRGIMLYPPNF